MAFSRKLPQMKGNDPIGDATIFSPWLWFRKGFLTLQALKETGKDPHIICIILHPGSNHLRFEGQQCSNRSWSTISKFDSKSLHFTNHQFPEIKSFLVEFPYWSTFWGKVQWHYQNWKIPSTRMIAILKKKTRDPLVSNWKHSILSFRDFFGWLTPNFEAHHLRPRNLQGNQNQFWIHLNLPRIDALPRQEQSFLEFKRISSHVFGHETYLTSRQIT